MNPKIFREYDIRGIVDKDFTDEDVYKLGKAFASFVLEEGGPEIVLGRDGRLSSPALSSIFRDGLLSCGAKVTDIGVVPTPLLYFAAHHLKSHGAVMITGSHNPPDYNGFKIMVLGRPFFGKSLQGLYEKILSKSFKEEKGEYYVADWSDAYLDFLVKDFHKNYGESSLRIAWDPGNGAAGNIVERLLLSLPGTHFLINKEIDGHFPSHHPDPTEPQNMRQLSEVVQREECDFGIGFDGDGDRIGVIDPKGRLVLGDQLLSLFAEEVLASHPGAHVLADVKSSQHLFKAISQLGGTPHLCKTGHSNIKIMMKELNAPLAGEMSGHIMFADRAFGFDDAIYAALRLVGILSKYPSSLEEWLNAQPKSFKTRELQIFSEQKFEDIEALKLLFQKEGKPFCDVDGVRFEDERGWWLARASNTQEFITIRIESTSKEHFNSLIEKVENSLGEIGIQIKLKPLIENANF